MAAQNLEARCTRGDFCIKVTGVIVVPLRVFKSKMTTVRVIPVPLRVSSQKIYVRN